MERWTLSSVIFSIQSNGTITLRRHKPRIWTTIPSTHPSVSESREIMLPVYPSLQNTCCPIATGNTERGVPSVLITCQFETRWLSSESEIRFVVTMICPSYNLIQLYPIMSDLLTALTRNLFPYNWWFIGSYLWLECLESCVKPGFLLIRTCSFSVEVRRKNSQFCGCRPSSTRL